MLAARAVEGDRLKKFEVYEEIDESEYDPELDDPPIDGRWVDEDRGAEGRSRVVAKDYKKKDDEIRLNYAGTPDIHGLRCLTSMAAEDRNRKMVLSDATSAYYQSPSIPNKNGRLPLMRAPADMCQRGKMWRLKRAMPGMQNAGRSWSDHQADVYVNKGGFMALPSKFTWDDGASKPSAHTRVSGRLRCACVESTPKYVPSIRSPKIRYWTYTAPS